MAHQAQGRDAQGSLMAVHELVFSTTPRRRRTADEALDAAAAAGGGAGGVVSAVTVRAVSEYLAEGREWASAAEQSIDECIALVTALSQRALQATGPDQGQPKKSKKAKLPGAVALPPPHLSRRPAPRELVAAKVASHELWILGTVTLVDPQNGIYEVEDVDEGEGNGSKRKHIVRSEDVLTLPTVAEAQVTHYQQGLRVMAMYPETTSFYPATIAASGLYYGGESFCAVKFDD
eukprot:CAMPEP_0118982666 /NCGR_PEP_ID=MMETSP1173-20130426/33373_1 /TAXON_ID=1034831 /ORGANISM="Rhizochromulina marina cf, Strain CCMP1243" /LENGTH=233 /DNA_ID=CAMNT_0006933175 /DNA_START=51 /DNA_END=749 /DNA_ORIENTATION=-